MAKKYTAIVGKITDSLIELLSTDRSILVTPVNADGNVIGDTNSLPVNLPLDFSKTISNLMGDFTITTTLPSTIIDTNLLYSSYVAGTLQFYQVTHKESDNTFVSHIYTISDNGGYVRLTTTESIPLGSEIFIFAIDRLKVPTGYDNTYGAFKIINLTPEFGHYTDTIEVLNITDPSSIIATPGAGTETTFTIPDTLIDDAADIFCLTRGVEADNVYVYGTDGTNTGYAHVLSVIVGSGIYTITTDALIGSLTSWATATSVSLPRVYRALVNMESYKNLALQLDYSFITGMQAIFDFPQTLNENATINDISKWSTNADFSVVDVLTEDRTGIRLEHLGVIGASNTHIVFPIYQMMIRLIISSEIITAQTGTSAVVYIKKAY